MTSGDLLGSFHQLKIYPEPTSYLGKCGVDRSQRKRDVDSFAGLYRASRPVAVLYADLFTDRVSTRPNAIASVRPSVHLFPL